MGNASSNPDGCDLTIARLKDRVKRLEKELDEKSGRIQELTRSKAAAKAHERELLARLGEKTSELSDRIKEVASERDKLKRRIDATERELVVRDARISQLETSPKEMVTRDPWIASLAKTLDKHGVLASDLDAILSSHFRIVRKLRMLQSINTFFSHDDLKEYDHG